MEGKKVVFILFALAIAIGVGTYVLYLLTRPDEENGGSGEFVPNAMVIDYVAPPAEYFLRFG
jgi:hypothetical protein